MTGSSATLSDSEAGVSQLLAVSRRRRLTAAEAVDLASNALDCTREEDAIPVLQSLLRNGVEPIILRHWLGLLHRAIDEHEAAIAILRQAARQAPRDAGIAHALARVTLEAGLPAADLFARASSLAPTDSDILLGRASARLAAGETDQGLRELDALLIQHPGWYAGHEAATHLRWMSGDRDGFVQSIVRALGTAPRDRALWLLLIHSLMHAKRYEQALAATAQARRAVGADARVLLQEASAVSALGDAEGADRLFDTLEDHSDPMIAVHHARHLLRAARPDAAAARLEPGIDKAGSEHLWPYLALAWRQLGDARYHWLLGDPALVGVYDIGDQCGDLAALAERLRSLHKATHQHLDQSVRGGTQTDGPLFSSVDPAIRRLRSAISDQVSAHIRRLPPVDPRHPVLCQRRDRPVRFSGSWSVRLTGRGHHAHHVHPAGWFSSAFYVSLPGPEEAGPPPAGWLALGAPPEELGLDLEPVRRIEPRPGRLVLFPSIMWHGTEPFGAGERLTAACDVALPAGKA